MAGKVRVASNPQPKELTIDTVTDNSVVARCISQCQSAIADALVAFSRIDILLICRSEALVGTIEELNQSTRTQSMARDQFETNFFAPVNVIRALLPNMREKRNGHIIALTGISTYDQIL